jgi:hypothetical protein
VTVLSRLSKRTNTTHAVPTRSLDPDDQTPVAATRGLPVATFHIPRASPNGVVSRDRPTHPREALVGQSDRYFVVVGTNSNLHKTMR